MRVSRRLLSGEKHKSLQSCSVQADLCILTGCCNLHLLKYNIIDSYTDDSMDGRLLP